MSTVWKARQRSLNRLVAVKILGKDFASNPEDVRRFHHEAQACANLDHAGIVRVYDVACHEGVPYIIMELIDGYTMGQLLRRKAKLVYDDGLIVLESVAYALNYAWQTAYMVHCDIKPDNIMIDHDGTVKVTDLGLAQTLAATVNTDNNDEVIGTPAYIAPEQAYGEQQLDCRTDIYALGASLYHLLTGHTLFPHLTADQLLTAHVQSEFQAPNICKENADIPQDFSYILGRMLAKDRDERYPDWATLLRDIQHLYAAEPLPKMSPTNFISSMLLS